MSRRVDAGKAWPIDVRPNTRTRPRSCSAPAKHSDALAVILAVFEQSCRAAVMTGAAPDDLVRRMLPRIVTTALTEPAE